jgi:hypothetical protein
VTSYFGISKVRYDHNHTHIDRVVKHLVNEVGIFDGRMASRYEIVDNLHNKVMYKTITAASNNTWNIGAEVMIHTIKGTEYIKTQANSVPCDNLGNLPEF